MSEPPQDTTSSSPPAAQPASSDRFQVPRWAHLPLKIGVSVALLAALLAYVDSAALVDALRHMDTALALAVLGLVGVRIALEWLIWHHLVAQLDAKVAPRSTLGSLLCGYTLAVFTPARLGELAARAYYLAIPDRFAIGSLTFLQGMLTQLLALGVGLVAATGYVLWQQPEPQWLWHLALGYTVLLLLVLSPAFVAPRAAHRWLSRWQRFPSMLQRLAFMQHFPAHRMAPVLALTVLRYAVLVTQFALLVLALDPVPSFIAVLAPIALVYWALYVLPPVTLADLGLREGAAVVFLGSIGVDAATAMGASLLLFAFNVLLPALIGTPFVMQLPASIKRTRNRSRTL